MMASRRPTGPTASPVLAFSPTQSAEMPSRPAIDCANLLFVRRQFGRFDKHDAIQVDDAIAAAGDFAPGRLQHLARVAPAVGRVGVGKHLADIAQSRGSQQRVGHRVQQRVGVAMPHGRSIAGNIDAAQPQRTAGSQAMRVVSDANACAGQWCKLLIPISGRYLERAAIIPPPPATDNANRGGHSMRLSRSLAPSRTRCTSRVSPMLR